MKVLYIYPKGDALIRQHVELLADGLRQSADIYIADSYTVFRQQLKTQQPDIVHCHGCWNFDMIRAALSGRKAGYAIITLGKLEQKNFLKLKWNQRVEVIHNAIITNTISPGEMCSQTFAVYQKVIDSNTLEQMDDVTADALSIIIKASLTGDRRWCRRIDPISHPEDIDWRRLMIYATHENILNYVDYGISILGLRSPGVDTRNIASYYPDNYTLPRPIKEVVGDYQGNETDYLLRMITQIHRQPLLLHMIELTRELMRDTVNDDQLNEALEEKKLKGFAASLMQVLSEEAELDEGFMPLLPVENRTTCIICNFSRNPSLLLPMPPQKSSIWRPSWPCQKEQNISWLISTVRAVLSSTC